MSTGTISMSDWNIKSITPLSSVGQLKRDFPLSEDAFKNVVLPARKTVRDIIIGEDPRLLVALGSCSVSNFDEEREYVEKLAAFKSEVEEHIFIVKRTCVDKPRTGRGWPGSFLDPDLNESYNIQNGWNGGRKLFVDTVNMGVPVCLELMDINTIQNLDDLVSYWWVGARTVSSTRLRQYASGLSSAVGFKNQDDGDVDAVIEAMDTATCESVVVAPHADVGRCRFGTRGNKFGHLILRGSSNGTNYSAEHVEEAIHKLAHRGLPTRILIDASHGNSGKDYRKQRDVIQDVVTRVAEGDQHIAGFMYESYLEEGKQKLPKDLSLLRPRVSVTDGCDSWETTKEVLLRTCDILSRRKDP